MQSSDFQEVEMVYASGQDTSRMSSSKGDFRASVSPPLAMVIGYRD